MHQETLWPLRISSEIGPRNRCSSHRSWFLTRAMVHTQLWSGSQDEKGYVSWLHTQLSISIVPPQIHCSAGYRELLAESPAAAGYHCCYGYRESRRIARIGGLSFSLFPCLFRKREVRKACRCKSCIDNQCD